MKAESPVQDGATFHLSLCERLAYSVGHVLNDLCASMWFTCFLVFLQSVAGFSHPQAGFLLFWGQFVDALCTPVIGCKSDRQLAAWHYGTRKSWHALGNALYQGCEIMAL